MSTDRRESEAIRRSREAADWVVQNTFEEERPIDQEAEFTQWVREDLNRAEFEEIVRITQLIRVQEPLPVATQRELLQDTDDCLDEAETVSPSWPGRRFQRSFVSVMLIILAALLLFSSFSVFVLHGRSLMDWLFSTSYSTPVAAEQDIRLPDGSIVTLEGDSAVSVNRLRRDLYLQRGGVRVQVAHDPEHSFSVHAEGVVVRALGTDFVVHRYSSKVRVWVTGGAVEVGPPAVHPGGVGAAGFNWERVRLLPGQEVAYDPRAGAGTPMPFDPLVSPAHVGGVFVYRSRPLAEVIEDIQRYTLMHITIDSGASDLKYTGNVFQREVWQWIESLPEIFPSLIVEGHGGAVTIKSRLAHRLTDTQSANR